MPESNEVEFGVLNIAAQPHHSGIYPQLLESVSRSPRQFWGSEFAAITAPERTEPGLFMGTVLVWTELDPDAPAVNKDTLQEVRLEDTAIVVPTNLGLNGLLAQRVKTQRSREIPGAGGICREPGASTND